jgi:geranylgeranyl diphosphate synthase type I
MSSSSVIAASAAGPDAVPDVLLRHQAAITRSLRATALPVHSFSGRMAAYHMGWVDRAGREVTSPSGKFIRPALCLWACEALGGNVELGMPAAVALEWIHNFTLVHDDIQDGDRLRRHRETVWSVFGQAQGINAGDALHALALRTLTAEGPHPKRRLRAAWVVANATLETVEGQCLDLSLEGRPDTPVRTYLRAVEEKTGALLGASLQAGAIMAGASPGVETALRRAGRLLGKAFQIRDDWLGTWGDPAHTGKPASGDVTRRKVTFPIVAGYARMAEAQKARLRELYGLPGPQAEVAIRELLVAAGGPGLTAAAPAHYASRAVSLVRTCGLDPRTLNDFIGVAHYVANRTR